MGDIELVILRCKKLEGMLEREFGAQGRGLHEKLSSVQKDLPRPLVSKLRFIASVRNKLVHEHGRDRLDDKNDFVRACDEAERQLRALHPVQSGCYVVTATYGPQSPQAIHVKRMCRKTFLRNPFMVIGWCLYKYYGPILAKFSQSSPVAFQLCRLLVATPIVRATESKRLIAMGCLAYLAILTLFGLLLLTPSILLSLCCYSLRIRLQNPVLGHVALTPPKGGDNVLP